MMLFECYFPSVECLGTCRRPRLVGGLVDGSTRVPCVATSQRGVVFRQILVKLTPLREGRPIHFEYLMNALI